MMTSLRMYPDQWKGTEINDWLINLMIIPATVVIQDYHGNPRDSVAHEK